MLRWSNDRAGIELYMSLEGKAALKVEEVIMNAKDDGAPVSVCMSIWMN